jgi:hypothetical protein
MLMTPSSKTLYLRLAAACAALACASGAQAFPVLPEARAFLTPALGFLNCGPASGGFAASCLAADTAHGNTEQTIAVDAGDSSASYILGPDPLINASSNFEPTYLPGGGEIDGGASSGTVSYQFAFCTDAACSVPGATVPVYIHYVLTVTDTPENNAYGITPLPFGYIAGLSLDYYGGTPVAQYQSCTYCSVQTLPVGQDVLTTTIRTNTVYELVLSAESEGDGIASVTLDPTLGSPDKTGTFVFSPLVSGGVPEPATWAFMLLGCGAAGSALRRRRSIALAA